MSMQSIIRTTLQKERESRGITQQQLATSVGVTRQTIIAIEKGGYTPSVVLALKISYYFQKPVEDLFILQS